MWFQHDRCTDFVSSTVIYTFVQKLHQAWLFLKDILAIPHDYSTKDISRLKCVVESNLIPQQQQNDIMKPHQSICWKFLLSIWSGIGTKWTYNINVVLLPDAEQIAFVGTLEACWWDRMYYGRWGIDKTFHSLQKHSAWFQIRSVKIDSAISVVQLFSLV